MAEVNGRHEAEPALTGEVVTGEVVEDGVAKDTPSETDPNSPGFITPKARTIVYISSLIVTVLCGLFTGIGLIMGFMTDIQAAQINSLILGSVALVNTSLGVAFRPTRPALTVGK
jgi:hypothetical protein